MLDEVNVLLLRQLRGFRQAVSALTDEQAVHDACAIRCCADREYKENGALVQEVFHTIVEDLADGRMIFSHHPLHAVDRADHV